MIKILQTYHSKRILGTAFMLSIFFCSAIAQDSVRYRNTFISPGYLQIKESLNYGLVFRGPALDAGMNWMFPHRSNIWLYEFRLMLGIPFAKDIAGMNMSIKPLEMAYDWKLPVHKLDLKVGPALKMEYNYQVYPDLQSGYYFWLTQYNAGISLFASLNTTTGVYRLRAFNNLVGFVSRGENWEDPYFFSDKFSDVFRDLHSDFEFVSPGTFNNTVLEVRYQRSSYSRLAYSYVFDYYVYSGNPSIKFLNQSLRLTFIPRMKNEN
jgi:hypothetical protein